MSFISDQIRNPEISTDTIAHGATNSIIQVVAEELKRLGLKGGLGNGRELRRVIFELVRERINDMRRSDVLLGAQQVQIVA